MIDAKPLMESAIKSARLISSYEKARRKGPKRIEFADHVAFVPPLEPPLELYDHLVDLLEMIEEAL